MRWLATSMARSTLAGTQAVARWQHVTANTVVVHVHARPVQLALHSARQRAVPARLVATTAASVAAAAGVVTSRCYCAASLDPERAAELEARSRELLAAAEAGDADALCEVGIVLMSNAVRKTEQKRAFDFLKRAAQQHQPRAQWALGSCYHLGIGTPKDVVEAVRWYAEAAALGEHESQHRLGVILASGEGGVAVDMPRAVRCWTQAAQANNAKAMLALGELYAHGNAEHHVPADRRLALDWLRRAAAAPDALTAAIAARAIARLEGADQPDLQE